MIIFHLGFCSINPRSPKILEQLKLYLTLIRQPWEEWGPDKIWIERRALYSVQGNNRDLNIELIIEFCTVFDLQYKIFGPK